MVKLNFKSINKLAVPALIGGIAEPILSITDTAIIGNIEINATESMGAVGIVGAFISMLIWVLGQTRSAISTIVSQHFGAKKLHLVKNLPAQAIFVVALIGALIIVITYPFARSIFKLYNASELLLDYSVVYYRIRVFGFPFTLFTMAVFGVFSGLQNTIYPMIIAVTGAVVNILLDYIFVYGIEGIIPTLNIKGAAYASVIAQFLMAALSVIFLLTKTNISLKLTFPFNKEIKTLMQMIANLFVRTLSLNVALYLASSYATKYGNEYLAAYTIAINIWFLGAFVIDGYSSAGNILSGNLFGDKQYKLLLKLGNKLNGYGLSVGVIMGLIAGVFYYPVGAIFTNDPAVLAAFYDIFWIVLAMQPLCALAFIYDGIFKGLGRMRYLRNVLLFSTFLIFVPVLLILDSYQLKLHAIFLAFTFWITARGIPLVIKFRKMFIPLIQKQ